VIYGGTRPTFSFRPECTSYLVIVTLNLAFLGVSITASAINRNNIFSW